jgi:hypothetical protein
MCCIRGEKRRWSAHLGGAQPPFCVLCLLPERGAVDDMLPACGGRKGWSISLVFMASIMVVLILPGNVGLWMVQAGHRCVAA